MKTCTNCAQVKPLGEYHRFAASRDGYRAQCKPCSLLYMRAPRGPRPMQGECRYCKVQFDYTHTSGQYRIYCGDDCRYRGGQALKLARAAESTRACACGSTDVNRVGKPVCPACRKGERDPVKAYAKERRRTLRRYGLTPERYDEMVAAQDGRCAICSTTTPDGKGATWHVDHCHQTGMVRGLLCHACNVSIGHFRDDPELLRRAAEYLVESRKTIARYGDLPSEITQEGGAHAREQARAVP